MDGFIVTNGEGQALSLGDPTEDQVHVLTNVKEVAEARLQAEGTIIYALVAIPIQMVPYITENRTHGTTKAAVLKDLALRFLGTLPWPDGSLPDPEETADTLESLDTWKE